jgi:integrase
MSLAMGREGEDVAMNLLTVKTVAKLLRRGQPGRHFDRNGLYLVIKSRNNAGWERRYELNHKAHALGLGSALRAFTLAEARERNRKVSQQLADGIDPLALKRQQRAAQAAAAAKILTFRQAAEAYIEAHQAKWRSRIHGQQWLTSLATYVYPTIGAIDVAAVDLPAVLRVLEQKVPAARGYSAGSFWLVRSTTADRVRNRVELVLSWAAGRGYRTADNPASWSRLKHILPKAAKIARTTHHAATPYAEAPAVMAELRQREGVASKALQFLILTVGRAGEVLGATWEEIDLDSATWTIPATRMKSGHEHRVPLSPPALELLRSLYREEGNPYLFIGSRNERLSHGALGAVMRRIGRDDETVHGFRSSFSDWAHERTGYASHVIELSLSHNIGGAVEKAYRRGDLFHKRRRLMQDWAKFCTSPPSRQTDNVVTMGAN